jgi:hypothetical protein
VGIVVQRVQCRGIFQRQFAQRLARDPIFVKVELLAKRLAPVVETPRSEKPQVQHPADCHGIEARRSQRASSAAASPAKPDEPHEEQAACGGQHDGIEEGHRRSVAQARKVRLNDRIDPPRICAFYSTARKRNNGERNGHEDHDEFE